MGDRDDALASRREPGGPRGRADAHRVIRADGRIVTTIEAAGEWWPAEDYHQEYWSGEGQRNPYCIATIPPKLQKLRKSFQARVKSAGATA